jgi:hypothetical protein
MPVKTGTKQLGLQPGAQVDTKSKGAPRTMRCKGCGGQAVEAPNGKGGKVLRCGNCRREYSFQTL